MDNVIIEKIEEYSALLDRKDELKEASVENNKAVEKCRDELAKMMIDEEIPSIAHAGYGYTLQNKVKWNKRAGMDDALFGVLRSIGLGDIIKETVSPQTLDSAINNLVEENGDELPEAFDGVVSKYEFNDISRRKKK